MIELPIYDRQGKQVDRLQIDEASLGGTVRFALLKQAYVITHGNQRQWSSRTKSRGSVEGSTRKLYKQKGTGNARAGAVRTPIRKGGGVTFSKTRTRDEMRTSLSKTARRLANRNALLAKLVDGEVKCVNDLSFKAPKTAEFTAIREALKVERSALVAVDGKNRNAMLSARNVDGISVCRIEQLNAFELLNHRYLIVDRASLESFLSERCFGDAAGQAAAVESTPKAKPSAKKGAA